LKVATFNVNNLSKRLPNLLAWLKNVEARRRVPAGVEGGTGGVSGKLDAHNMEYGI
jgi:hypothetical protein